MENNSLPLKHYLIFVYPSIVPSKLHGIISLKCLSKDLKVVPLKLIINDLFTGTNFDGQYNSPLMVLEYCSSMGMDKLDGQHGIVNVVCMVKMQQIAIKHY